MTKINKTRSKQMDELFAALTSKGEALEASIEEFNEQVSLLWEKLVSPAIEAYNAEIREADELKTDIVSQMQDYYDDKSETWQDGTRGQAYQSWISAWEYEELSSVELDAPDGVECPDLNGASIIESLPMEVEA